MLLVFSGLLALMVDICLAQDVKGSRDHPLFSRMPGYTIQRYEEKTFEAHPFRMAAHKVLQVEGRFVQIRYALKTGAKEPSRLEIGICIDCGDAVAYERLAAYPTAKRCLGCQQQRERTYAHQGTPRL